MNFQDLERRRLQTQVGFFVKTAEPIPADKADWKPAETAMSAMEMTRHCIHTNNNICQALGGEAPNHDPDSVSSLAQAIDLFEASCQHMSDLLASIPDERLEEEIPTSNGETTPITRIMGVPAVHVSYHWGQLAYLQTLWGDTDDHFLG